MIDLLAVLPLSIALHGPAHDSLASGPQPRDLAWTSRAAFEPVNGDVIYTEKWSAVAGRMEVRTRLKPGRGITNAPEALGRVSGYRERRPPALPLPPLCCGWSGETPPGNPTPPVSQVPLPASAWLMLTGICALVFVTRKETT